MRRAAKPGSCQALLSGTRHGFDGAWDGTAIDTCFRKRMWIRQGAADPPPAVAGIWVWGIPIRGSPPDAAAGGGLQGTERRGTGIFPRPEMAVIAGHCAMLPGPANRSR